MTAISHGSRLVAFALAVIAAMLGTGCASAMPATRDAPRASASATSATVTGPADLDGTYRFTISQEDAEKAGDPEADIEGTYPQTQTITLNDGELEGGCFGAAGGTYKVAKDRITFHSDEYDAESTVTFSLDGEGNLHLTPVPPMDPGDAFQCFSKPWTKIE